MVRPADPMLSRRKLFAVAAGAVAGSAAAMAAPVGRSGTRRLSAGEVEALRSYRARLIDRIVAPPVVLNDDGTVTFLDTTQAESQLRAITRLLGQANECLMDRIWSCPAGPFVATDPPGA